ncbi:hypothetical protein B0H14DRAFT_2607549 [Mycena olivaceomarginata]|nr:hypothetical protein B0H14DRAFT_2607549 [Mycena olivaceomarginata]
MDMAFKESVPQGIGCIPGTENQCHGFIVDTGDQTHCQEFSVFGLIGRHEGSKLQGGRSHQHALAFRGLSPPCADIDLAERGLDFLNIQIQREGWGGGNSRNRFTFHISDSDAPKETGQPRLRIDVTSRAASWDYGREIKARVDTRDEADWWTQRY